MVVFWIVRAAFVSFVVVDDGAVRCVVDWSADVVVKDGSRWLLLVFAREFGRLR